MVEGLYSTFHHRAGSLAAPSEAIAVSTCPRERPFTFPVVGIYLGRQIEKSEADTEAVGGSWEPSSMIAHCHRLKAENEKLREQIKSAKYCLYFLLKQHGGKMQISRHDIAAVHPDDAIVNCECHETGDQNDVVNSNQRQSRESDSY